MKRSASGMPFTNEPRDSAESDDLSDSSEEEIVLPPARFLTPAPQRTRRVQVIQPPESINEEMAERTESDDLSDSPEEEIVLPPARFLPPALQRTRRLSIYEEMAERTESDPDCDETDSDANGGETPPNSEHFRSSSPCPITTWDPKIFSPIPSTSRDLEMFKMNDLLLQESLEANEKKANDEKPDEGQAPNERKLLACEKDNRDDKV